MSIEDVVHKDGAGDVVTCPNGHPICDVVVPMRTGDIIGLKHFANWREPDYEPKPGDKFPLCFVCGQNPWLTPAGTLRPRTQRDLN